MGVSQSMSCNDTTAQLRVNEYSIGGEGVKRLIIRYRIGKEGVG